MPPIAQILAFAAASLTIVAVPGPAIVYLVTRCVSDGRRAGLASVLGIEAGTLVHVAAAALGLSALVASAPGALTAIRWAGVAYLLWLAVQAYRTRGAARWEEADEAGGALQAFRQGVVVEILNPKTALFFLAFLPQFVDPGRGPAAQQVLVLGAAFVAIAVVCDTAWVLAAGAARRRLAPTPHTARLLRTSAGVTYALLAVAAAAI